MKMVKQLVVKYFAVYQEKLEKQTRFSKVMREPNWGCKNLR